MARFLKGALGFIHAPSLRCMETFCGGTNNARWVHSLTADLEETWWLQLAPSCWILCGITCQWLWHTLSLQRALSKYVLCFQGCVWLERLSYPRFDLFSNVDCLYQGWASWDYGLCLSGPGKGFTVHSSPFKHTLGVTVLEAGGKQTFTTTV